MEMNTIPKVFFAYDEKATNEFINNIGSVNLFNSPLVPNISVIDVTTNSIQVLIDDRNNSKDNNDEYEVKIENEDEKESNNKTIKSNKNKITIDKLNDNTKYKIFVRTKNKYGISPFTKGLLQEAKKPKIPMLKWDKKSYDGNANITYLSDNKIEAKGNGYNQTIICVDFIIRCNENEYKSIDIEFEVNRFYDCLKIGFVGVKENKPNISDWNVYLDKHGFCVALRSDSMTLQSSESCDIVMVKKDIDYHSSNGDKIVLRFNTAEKLCELIINGNSKGIIFRNIPTEIIPAISHSFKKSGINTCSVRCVQVA